MCVNREMLNVINLRTITQTSELMKLDAPLPLMFTQSSMPCNTRKWGRSLSQAVTPITLIWEVFGLKLGSTPVALPT
jgi:hypothetical protein